MKRKNINQNQCKISLNKTYQPTKIQESLYDNWEKNDYFSLKYNKNKENFCIVLPPPNITGNLHIGHAFQQTIMDILIRYHRMQGKNTLWQSGTDHAGIATQMIVERKIAIEENKTRYNYGRNEFIKKIWQWQIESSKNISEQMKRLGNSIDWKKERFTMDAGFSKAVKKAFILLYKDNLIYRDKRLVNWDPKLHTAISDLEVENREVKGFIWYLRYPLADKIKTLDGLNYLVIATTRPETIFGDAAVAVNPEDSRYNNLIGKNILLPLVNRRIPIIGDKHANIKKGTGCFKITPAHDFKDYQIGKTHKLIIINIFDYNGYIREKPEIFNKNNYKDNIIIPINYRGIERFIAREKIINEFKKLKLLVAIKPHNLTIPYGDRSGVIIEPMITNQWYLRTITLAKQAIIAVKDGRIKFIPKQYENMYFSWMNNIKDWCISRQLWWGHRIPVWYDNIGNIYVGNNEEEIRLENKINSNIKLKQDEDVLDTWFSSSLWTFSVLGWPENYELLKNFHPIDVLVSGFDIIFFWISRMIMLTMYFIKDSNGKDQIPFKIIYITGLIRDQEGHKMSKSKGNVIDPLDIIDGISLKDLLIKRTKNMMKPQLIEKITKLTNKEYPNGIKAYGADALRFTLTILASTGRDINWDIKRLNGYHNFCNKLWNASRYVLINTENYNYNKYNNKIILSLSDKWIITELNKIIKLYREALDTYRFDIAANILYEFIWNQFCNWYVELSKSILNKGNKTEIYATRYTLIEILDNILRLAHPIIPFITESIWQKVKIIKNISENTIMLQPFPTFVLDNIDIEAHSNLEWIKELIITIRNIKSEMNIPSNKTLNIMLYIDNNIIKEHVIKNLNFIKIITHLNSITILNKKQLIPNTINKIINNAEILIPMLDIINKETEIKRLNKDLNKLIKKIEIIQDKLSNNNFINLAPFNIVEKERKLLTEYLIIKQKINNEIININSL